MLTFFFFFFVWFVRCRQNSYICANKESVFHYLKQDLRWRRNLHKLIKVSSRQVEWFTFHVLFVFVNHFLDLEIVGKNQMADTFDIHSAIFLVGILWWFTRIHWFDYVSIRHLENYFIIEWTETGSPWRTLSTSQFCHVRIGSFDTKYDSLFSICWEFLNKLLKLNKQDVGNFLDLRIKKS